MNYFPIVLFLLGAFLVYLSLRNPSTPPKSKSEKNRVNDFIRKIVRQAARWTTAAEQDTNPLIKVLHANYGAAYIFALGDAGVDPEQIEKAMGSNFNYNQFRDHIVQVQDDAGKIAVVACPSFGPPMNPFTEIAGE